MSNMAGENMKNGKQERGGSWKQNVKQEPGMPGKQEIKQEPAGTSWKEDSKQNQNFRNAHRGMYDRNQSSWENEMHDNPKARDVIRERLINIGPTTNLETENTEAKKFSGRCRLFVGNLPHSTTEEQFKKMFQPYGEIADVFLNKQKGFGFVKLDTRQNAESARAALDFSNRDGKVVRVRFAAHGAALKLKNLTPWVSNELLELTFSVFGEVERAVVIVDDRGHPVGEGIVEFARKQSAQLALKRCTEGCLLLTSAARPLLVEPLEYRDEEEGFPEKNIQKNNPDYLKERELGPRFADPGTFEFEYGNRWKKLSELECQKRSRLDREIMEDKQHLDDQQGIALFEHETNVLRDKLRAMEERNAYMKREWDMRLQDDLRREEQRQQEEHMLRKQEEDILRKRSHEDMRRQESMMMQRPSNFDHPQNMGGMSGNPMAPVMDDFRGIRGHSPADMMGPRDFNSRDVREPFDIDAKRRKF